MRRFVRPILPLLCIAAPAALSAQVRDTVRVDSTRVARQYDLQGITVRVARPALTTGGSSAVIVRLDSLGSTPAPSMEAVLEWRALQEHKLAERSDGASQLMTEADIRNFVQHFERLTRHALAEMPSRADYVLRLADDHSITEALVR